MILKNKNKALIIVLVVCIAIAGFLWLRSYVFSNMGLSLQQKIQSLELSGFKVKYDSIDVSWVKSTIDIHGLLLERNPYDTTCLHPEFIAVGRVRAEGVRFFPLLFSDVLDFERLLLEDPRMVMRKNSLMRVDSATRRESEFTLRIDEVRLQGANIQYTDSARCDIITMVKSNLAVNDLEMEFHVDKPFAYKAASVFIDSTVIELPRDFYTLRIKQARMNFAGESLDIDSIRVIPHFGKVEFGRKRGHETDRFDGVVPFIKLRNFVFSFADSSRVEASQANIQFFVKIFRDKRLPFKKVAKLLPIDALQDLPFALRVDTLRVTNSFVQYEEFAEEATDAGGIFFDNLNAVITNVDNGKENGNATMKASAALMGRGSLSMAVTFPLDRNKRASVSGALENFPIPELNPMLMPTTNMKVESGEMKKLTFNFSFNAVSSKGEVELNYEDLKLISFKEESKQKNDDELQKDNLKTFIMNTFIFRKNMDESVPEEKRTGTIMFERDNNRSIFNFWSKSLLSGIKSAYNLDKVAEKQGERDEKREERLARRQERKLKKAEKKKERG